MHLIALVDGPDHVCCRYRVSAFKPYLERAGHTVEILPLPYWWWSRLWLMRRLGDACVLVQRHLLPCWQVYLLRQASKYLLFDLDDAVWLRDSYSPKGLEHPRKSGRFAYTARQCDAVIAGNEFLAEHARAQGARNVHVIPTCVEPSLYAPGEGDGRTMVWVGSSSTLQGLERVAAMLDGLSDAAPGARLKVICDRFPSFRQLPVLPVMWDGATEARELAGADVGISWIPDDPWSRGKCGLKVLQYMAAGLPVLTNPVGVHLDMVTHGETGLLATTPEEWKRGAAALLGDPGLRRRMGQAGRLRLEAKYSVAEGARRWLGVLDELERRARRVG